MSSGTRPYRARPKEVISRYMSRIRGRDTALERTLGSAMWKAGLRYRKQGNLPGRPDFYSLARIHRRTPMDGVRKAEGG